MPIVQNRISNVQRRRSRQSVTGISRQPIRRSFQPARPQRPTRTSLLRNQRIEETVRRTRPIRDRRLPKRFDGFQMS